MDKKKINNIKDAVRNEIIKLSAQCGSNASLLLDDEIIPQKGYLDSASIIELVLWIENYFKIRINDEDINIDNLGSVNSITNFVVVNKKD